MRVDERGILLRAAFASAHWSCRWLIAGAARAQTSSATHGAGTRRVIRQAYPVKRGGAPHPIALLVALREPLAGAGGETTG